MKEKLMYEKSIYSVAVPASTKVECRRSILNTLILQREEKRNGRKSTENGKYLKGQILTSATVLREYKFLL